MIEIIQPDFIVAANVFILSLLVTLTIKCQATNAGYFDLHLVNNKGRTLLYNSNRVSIEQNAISIQQMTIHIIFMHLCLQVVQ